MIVVLAVIVLITAVVLTGQSQFDRSLVVTDTAYTVALSIRQAQTYGLSSRIYSGISNAAYGVHFTSAGNKTYLLFADVYPAAPGTSSSYCPGHTAGAGSPAAKPGNCLYDSTQGEMVQNFSFNRGFYFSDLCGHDSGGILRCTSQSYLDGIEILYLRPNTDAIIVGLRSAGNIVLTDAQLTIAAPGGSGTRYICVSGVGQVSVSATTCP